MRFIFRILVLLVGFVCFCNAGYRGLNRVNNPESFISSFQQSNAKGKYKILKFSCSDNYCLANDYYFEKSVLDKALRDQYYAQRDYNSICVDGDGFSYFCSSEEVDYEFYKCDTFSLYQYEALYLQSEINGHITSDMKNQVPTRCQDSLITSFSVTTYNLSSKFSLKQCPVDQLFDLDKGQCIEKPQCSDGQSLDPGDNTCKECLEIHNRQTRFRCMCEMYEYGDYVSDTVKSYIPITNGGSKDYNPINSFDGEIRCSNGVINTQKLRDDSVNQQTIDYLLGMDDEEYTGGSTGSSGGSGSGSGSGGSSSESSDIDCNKAVNALRKTYNSLASSTFNGVDCSAPEFSASKALYAGLKSALSAVSPACGGVPDEVRGIYDVASRYNLNCIDTGEVYKDPDDQGGGGSSTDPGGSEGGGGTTVTEPGDNPGGESQEGGSPEGSETGGDGECSGDNCSFTGGKMDYNRLGDASEFDKGGLISSTENETDEIEKSTLDKVKAMFDESVTIISDVSTSLENIKENAQELTDNPFKSSYVTSCSRSFVVETLNKTIEVDLCLYTSQFKPLLYMVFFIGLNALLAFGALKIIIMLLATF